MNSDQAYQTGSKMDNHVCSPGHIRVLDNFLRPWVHSPRRLFGPHIGPGMKALDIGCGGGFASLGLARLAGPEGRVVAADLQPQMLQMVARRAEKAGLADRIRLHQSDAYQTGLEGPFDFILAFWMAHEHPDPSAFLREVENLLKPGGRFFLAEPKMHVSPQVFRDFVAEAEALGLMPINRPFVLLSRAVVLEKS